MKTFLPRCITTISYRSILNVFENDFLQIQVLIHSDLEKKNVRVFFFSKLHTDQNIDTVFSRKKEDLGNEM